jgi:hypothetical protein
MAIVVGSRASRRRPLFVFGSLSTIAPPTETMLRETVTEPASRST